MSVKNKMRVASVITLILWGFVWSNVILGQAILPGIVALLSMMAYPIVLFIQYKIYGSVDPLYLFTKKDEEKS